MDLTPNSSLFVQVITFVILWVALKKLMFDPVLAVLDERNRRTSGALEEAGTVHQRVDEAQASYERATRDARQVLGQEMQSARAAAQLESSMIIDAARSDEAAAATAMRASVERQVTEARTSLATEAPQLASAMLARVTGGAP